MAFKESRPNYNRISPPVIFLTTPDSYHFGGCSTYLYIPIGSHNTYTMYGGYLPIYPYE